MSNKFKLMSGNEIQENEIDLKINRVVDNAKAGGLRPLTWSQLRDRIDDSSAEANYLTFNTLDLRTKFYGKCVRISYYEIFPKRIGIHVVKDVPAMQDIFMMHMNVIKFSELYEKELLSVSGDFAIVYHGDKDQLSIVCEKDIGIVIPLFYNKKIVRVS